MNKTLVTVTGTILVNQSVTEVFSFFANPSNDHRWRTEINKTVVDGPLQAGVTVFEYSNLSKRVPNNLLQLTCVQFDKNKMAIFETGGNTAFYLKSRREVQAVTNNTTEVSYTLDFDRAIVKFAIGFALPKFIVAWKATGDMKKYLRQLKAQLDAGS